MTPAGQVNADLDILIEEISVDAHDEDEQPMGFEAAFDEDASLLCQGTVISQEVDVLSISRGDYRHELTPTCQRAGKRYEIALLDIDINADTATSRRIDAYRRWVST